MTTVHLWALLRRRDTASTDPQRLAAVLAIIAFAVTTAVSLLVIGGFQAFAARGSGADLSQTTDSGIYLLLAGTASGLLLIPLLVLGGAAARLTVARRDARLAALRLAGATTAQVGTLALLDSTVQAAAGAALGAAGYFGLIPLAQLAVFQGRRFDYGELVLPWWIVALAVVTIVLVALTSAAASLRRVSITPLGVAARTRPPGLHWTRVVPLVLAGGSFAVLLQQGLASLVVLIVLLFGGIAFLNVLGPWVLGVAGTLVVNRAKSAATLIAARRLVDAPKTAWRGVGGVALATFVASMAAAAAMLSADSTDQLTTDLGTGGALTLIIAAVVAAVSTGVMQAGRIIDQRSQYRALHLAGTDLKVMDAARLREVAIPLATAVIVATAASSLFLIPALGIGLLSNPIAVGRYLLSVLGAAALVLAGSWATKPVMRTVISDV